MGKRRVTFYRDVTGVEEIKMMLDVDIDLNVLTEGDADKIISEAIMDGTCFIDHELIEQDLPHKVETDEECIDISQYTKENG